MLKYDGITQQIHVKPESFRHEIYHRRQVEADGEAEAEDGEESEAVWQFTGLVTQSLNVQPVEDVAAGTDRALETLKNTMASIEQDREARKCVSAFRSHTPVPLVLVWP